MFYAFAKIICYIFLKYINRWEITGKENFPLEGPVIVVSNHTSYLDPVAVGVALPRPIFYMAKKELFQIPVLKLIIKGLHAFPVDRQRFDRTAIKKALQLLNSGKVLGIFPEGRRNLNDKLSTFQNGAAVLALKTGAPIVPVALKNTSKLFFGRVKVIIDKPIFVKSNNRNIYNTAQELTEEVFKRLSEMLA